MNFLPPLRLPVMLLLMGSLLVPVPAVATPDGVTANLQGVTLEIGEEFHPDDGCDQSGEARVRGKGLHFADRTNSKDTAQVTGAVIVDKTAVFSVPGVGVSVAVRSQGDQGDPRPRTGVLSLCGSLAPTLAGIGASCGFHTANNGRGKLIVLPLPAAPPLAIAPRLVYEITNFGWSMNAGGALVLSGQLMQVDNEEAKSKVGTKRPLTGTLRLNTPTDCANEKPHPGATQFTATGSFGAPGISK